MYPFPGAPGLYVGREEEVPRPPKVLQRWTTDVEPRLWIDIDQFQKEIRQTKRGRKSLPRISLELRMSGYAAVRNATHVELFPRVWILYDKDDWRKEIQKFVRKNEWLEDEGFGKVEVRIGSPQLRTIAPSVPILGLDLRSEEAFIISEGLHLYLHVESHESETATGRICCATLTNKANDRILGQRISRIGGIISVNGREMAITTAHGMLELCWEALQSYDSGDDDEDEDDDCDQDDGDTDDEQSDAYSCGGSSTSSRGLKRSDTNPADDGHMFSTVGGVDYALISSWQYIQAHGMTSFLGVHDLVPDKVALAAQNNTAPLDLCDDDRKAPQANDTDFSLWCPPSIGLKNQYLAKEGEKPTFITIRSSPPFDAPTSVVITIRPGASIAGNCLPGQMSFMVYGVKFLTRKIRLDAPIALGCSGAWVVMDGQLCGMIIAGYDHEPYAHMVTCDALFKHTKAAIPTASYIELPDTVNVSSGLDLAQGPSSQFPVSHTISRYDLYSRFGDRTLRLFPDHGGAEGGRLLGAIRSFIGRKEEIMHDLNIIRLQVQHLQGQHPPLPLYMTLAKEGETRAKLQAAQQDMHNVALVFDFWYGLVKDDVRASVILKADLSIKLAVGVIQQPPGVEGPRLTITCEELNVAVDQMASIANDLVRHFPSDLQLQNGSKTEFKWELESEPQDPSLKAGRPEAGPSNALWDLLQNTKHILNEDWSEVKEPILSGPGEDIDTISTSGSHIWSQNDCGTSAMTNPTHHATCQSTCSMDTGVGSPTNPSDKNPDTSQSTKIEPSIDIETLQASEVLDSANQSNSTRGRMSHGGGSSGTTRRSCSACSGGYQYRSSTSSSSYGSWRARNVVINQSRSSACYYEPFSGNPYTTYCSTQYAEGYRCPSCGIYREASSSLSGGSSSYRPSSSSYTATHVSQRGHTTVINHHRVNPSYDEPSSSESRSYSRSHRRLGSSRR